jgi:SAM-dependent methyltransferase
VRVGSVVTKESVVDTSKLFEDKAQLYASSRPLYPSELFNYIASLVSMKGAAWDCATGNGQAAIGLAKIFRHVEATDVSPEQIANAFQLENVTYSVQSSESTSFLDSQFDLVNVAQALHWFDYEKFWGEVSRVLKPTGVFVAFSYIWPIVEPAIDAVVKERINKITTPYWAPNNRLLWDEYRALDLPFTPLDSPQIDIVNHWNASEFLDYLHTWSGTRKCMESIGSAFFSIASDEIRAAWGDPQEKKVVVHPLTVIAGKAWS